MPYMVIVGAWKDEADPLFDGLANKLAKGATIRDFAEVDEGDVVGEDEEVDIRVEKVREEVREEPTVRVDARGPTSSRAPSPESSVPEMERRILQRIDEMGQSIESRMLSRIDEMGRSIESRLMSRVDELGRSLDSRVDGLFDELNKKIDRIAEKIRDKPSEDSAPFDIQEGAAESGIGDIPVAGDDQMTYVTPVTEVHSGVFVDEDRGDTIHVVTSPLSGVKTRVRKRGKALCTPYTARERPKRRKKETAYDPLRVVEEARMNALLKWTLSTDASMTIRGGTTEMTREFFRDLLTPGVWISNEVWIMLCFM